MPLSRRRGETRRGSTSATALRVSIASASVLAAVMLLSGCTSSAATPHSTATITITPTATSTTSVPTPSTSSSTTGTAASRCPADALRGAWKPGSGAAGTQYGELVLTDTGSSPCTLHGWPGVSLVTGTDGAQLGAAAKETSGTRDQQPITVTLSPGTGASAQVGIATAQNYGTRCRPQQARGFRVYPPGSADALFVPAAVTGCDSTSIDLLTVAPVQPDR